MRSRGVSTTSYLDMATSCSDAQRAGTPETSVKSLGLARMVSVGCRARFAGIGLVILVVITQVPAASPTVKPQEDGYVGSTRCMECHLDSYESYRLSPHAVTETDPDRWSPSACERCHGPGETHVASEGEPGTIFTWTDPSRTADEKSSRCLDCHAEHADSLSFLFGDHLSSGVGCASCHAAHPESVDEATSVAQSVCLECHRELEAFLQLNERHRVSEGMVACTDCHQPHRPSPRLDLGGFRHEVCLNCHTDKQGPFVFEHLSQSVEGCSTCHAVHGSVNRHLLSFQSTADLCYSCHVEVPGFHKGAPSTPIRFDQTSVCTNCHSQIHGSNLDPAFLR